MNCEESHMFRVSFQIASDDVQYYRSQPEDLAQRMKARFTSDLFRKAVEVFGLDSKLELELGLWEVWQDPPMTRYRPGLTTYSRRLIVKTRRGC